MIAVPLYLTGTESGRGVLARVVENVVSDRIPGWITIGRIEHIGRTTVGRDLVLFHPDGREVLSIKRAAIDFDLTSLLAGDLAAHRGSVDGSQLSLWIGPDGRSSIEAALDFKETPTSGSGRLFGYSLQDIKVRDSLLVLSLSKNTTYRVHGARGTVSIWRERGAMVELRGVSGRVEPGLAGMDVRLGRVDGWVHGRRKQVLKLNARVHVGNADLRAKVALFDRERTPVEISLRHFDGAEATIAALLAYTKGQFTDDIDITLGGT